MLTPRRSREKGAYSTSYNVCPTYTVIPSQFQSTPQKPRKRILRLCVGMRDAHCLLTLCSSTTQKNEDTEQRIDRLPTAAERGLWAGAVRLTLPQVRLVANHQHHTELLGPIYSAEEQEGATVDSRSIFRSCVGNGLPAPV